MPNFFPKNQRGYSEAMKIGRLNRASFAKTARRAMFLFAFAALGTQAAMVAKVGDVGYETLEKAVMAVKTGETIVLQENVVEKDIYFAWKSFTLDLNGFSAEDASSSDRTTFYVNNGAELAIVDRSAGGGGTTSVSLINSAKGLTIGESTSANGNNLTIAKNVSAVKDSIMTVYGGVFKGGISSSGNAAEYTLKVFGGRFTALPKYAAVEYPAGQTLVKGENGYVLGEAPLEYDLDAASVEISLGNGRIYTVKQTSADTKNTVCVTVPSGVEATLVLDGIKNTGAAIVLNVAEGATLWVELDGENVVGSTSCSSTAPFRKIGAGLLVIQDENGEPGSLTATVGQNAAAIGGSYKESVSNIEIKSGTITATSGQNGAAIGAGGSSYDSSTHGYVGGEASNITVSGGTLKLTSGLNGAVIGAGSNGSAEYITVSGGTLTLTGGQNGAVIGAGSNGSAENITVSGGTLTLTGGKSPLGAPSTSKNTNVTVTGGTFATANVTAVKPFLAEGVTIDETTGKVVQLCNDEKSLRKAFYEAPTDGTAVTVKLGADITLETLYAAENFGTEKLDDNAAGDTFNRYKVGVHPTAEDPNHWNPLVTGQTQEQRLVYGAYYHMSATDERIARLVVKAGQKIVLDLNGHTIQKNARATHGDWSEVCTDIIGNYGTLEIMDSSTGAKGTIKGIGYISCQGAVLHNYKDATMTVTGVNVDGNAAGMAKGTGQYAIANEGGTLTLDGVNVHDTATSASLIMSNGGTVTIKNATLSHPATKVINAKGGVINIESASVTSEEYAVFVTGDARVNVNGSLTIEGTGTLCVEGDAAALTKKAGVELSAPAGFTWVENDGVQVLKSFVAKVGKTAYVTIAEALAALNAENHTLTLLNENAWDAATPVYWAAGTQSGYAKTLTEALTAAYKANAGAITIVCRPGVDVGTMTHGHVADDLTIYGNDAFISGGECDLEVDQYKYSRATGAQAADGAYLEKDITITAYELDNLGVWGQRHTAHKVTVNLTDCDGKALEGKTNVQRVYISGTTGVNDITLTDCDFLTKATAVYSNADGAIKAVNCSFTGGEVPFNINHKANGTQTVAVENCKFTNCGDVGGWKQFAAPLRLVNSGTGTQSAEVTGCAFAGTVGANGDILLGDGRTGQTSNDVALKVTDTEANIQAQKPGYYNGETVDETKKATATSPASGTLETSVAKLLPVDPRTLGYATSGKAEALPAAPDMSGEVVNVTAAQAQYVLDGAYGPIDGKTINFTESINDTLILGRASKYDGSKTVYRHGSHAGEALSYADFIAYKNQSVWTESCYYERTVENVTFTANEGVTVKNFEADGGAHIYAGTAPVYDYVRDTGSWVTEGSCYFKRAILQNITFKGLTFKAKTDINTSESTTVYDGFTFKDCTFDLGTTADGNQAIRYYNENNNGNVKNLVVEGCTFKTCSQGVYTAHVKNVTVTGSTFDTTGHNAIAIQDFKGACDHGEVVITGNTFKGIGDRIIRFNNVGLGTTVTIKDNTADGNSGKLDEATGKREIVKATTLPVNAADSIKASGNNWGANTVVEGVFIDDYATKLGTEACPYSREQFAAMTRAEYSAAQERLGGTLYVNVGDYTYGTDGVLGNGVRNDTPGQVPDHSKLNAYGENGYLGEKNDGANGQTVVFVGGTITSGVTGYTSIDNIGTSLLLAMPAYTKVTFEKTTFKNVLSFNYQLYTSPWSQLGGLTFNGCTFDGIIVGAIAAQELAFNGCTFNNYVNTTSANSSNPTWIRPAYGNWTKGDNEGQGTDFRSLTKITFENNTVTSTRPVKFECIAQWEMATTVTATYNTFAITPQEGDKDEKKTKNVGLYFGANAKFDLVIDENKKSNETAALYTAVYSAPNKGTYVGLPAGSTVKNAAGEEVSTGDGDALAWKTTKKITLKTTTEVASVTNAKGVSVNFATLSEAVKAAQAGETVTLLADITLASKQSIKKELTLDLNGKTLTGTAYQTLSLGSGANVTIQDSSAEKTGKVANGYKGSADPYTICLDGYDAAALTLVSGTVEANPHKTDLQSVAINTNHEKDGPYAINIRGGKVFVPESSTNGRAIVAGENVTLTVEGGEIVGGLHGVDVYDGSMTAITGGSISARAVDTGVIEAAYGLRATGTASVTIGAADGAADVVSVAGIKMDDNGSKLDVPAVTVKSGTIAGPVYSITPGTIVFNVQATSEDVLRFADDTAAKFLPSNLELRAKDIDGKTMYYVAAKPVAAIGAIGYETLEAALAAAKDGETVKLLADVTESVTIAADRTLTLDLNGKTLSAGKASEALTVTGHLTIDDTSAAKSGRVVGDGRYAVYMNNRTAHVGEAAVGGSLTLNAGSLEGATYGVYIRANQAAFTMNGGKVSATQGESIRVNNDYHAKTISLLSGEVGDVFLGSISSTELTTLTVGKADQIDPAAVKVGKIGLQYNRGQFRLELYNGLVGELPEIGSCTATYTALGMLVKSNANCPSGKVFEKIDYNGETWYRIAALQKIAITFDDSKTVALPFATDWLKAHVGEGEATWTTVALEEKAKNGLAKWQCYLFGLDPNKKDAKVVATAGQGTDEAIPLAVANADASASPLVTGGYVTVAYVLMGSNDRTAWTQVVTSDERDGLAIPLTGTTYKFYRVDVTVTSAEGN